MARFIVGEWFSALSLVGLAALGCRAGGIGDPCIPEDEYQNLFSGYSVEQTNVESRSFQCETRICLVNHFQGRVSCPYGQTQEAISDTSLSGGDEYRCKIPGTLGEERIDQVLVAVPAQLAKRRPERAVYCSCRCANAAGGRDDGAKYCYPCPSGFECTSVVEDLKLQGQAQLAGSYCIKAGTKYKAIAAMELCQRPDGCGDAQPY
ncbi:hypothetical protein ACFL5O_08770 [Myxococcota bacterium]